MGVCISIERCASYYQHAHAHMHTPTKCTHTHMYTQEVIWVIISVDDSGIMDLTQQMSSFSTEEGTRGHAPSPYPDLFPSPSYPTLVAGDQGLHTDGLVRTHDGEPNLHADLEALAPLPHKPSLDDMQL